MEEMALAGQMRRTGVFQARVNTLFKGREASEHSLLLIQQGLPEHLLCAMHSK